MSHRFLLYRLLSKHKTLSIQRAFDHERNKAAKVFIAIGFVFIIVYLGFIAFMLSAIATSIKGFNSVEFICALAPFILLLDFLARFIFQQTPAQLVKPYLLLNIPRYTCINHFVAASLCSWYNIAWFALLIPYLLMSVLFNFGSFIALKLLLFYYFLILLNSQWYAINRSLINCNIFFGLISLLGYTLLFAPMWHHGSIHFRHFLLVYAHLNSDMPIFFVLIALCIITYCNRNLQYRLIKNELSKEQSAKKIHLRELSYLNRFGETGYYLHLEIKSLFRNKNPRKTFIMSLVFIILLSALVFVVKDHENPYFFHLFINYNFIVFSIMMLVKLMCYEGNYIDCLMLHKENIYALLKAKYVLHCSFTLIPFCCLLPALFMGEVTLLMLIAYALFTCGLQYFVLFQMAVYNREKVSLNAPLSFKANMDTNYFQSLVSTACMILPALIISIAQSIFPENTSYFIMSLVGILFIATHRLWLRNIYSRIMKRRYTMLEGFKAS